MRTSTAAAASRLQHRLEGLQDRTILGPPIRFYLRREEQLLYLFVGGWNTVFGYAVWAALQLILGGYLHYLVIVLLSWPIAVVNAYLGYRYVVFRSRGPIRRELPRFSLVYVLTLVVNLMLLPVALAVLPLNIYVIQAVFTAGVVVCSYLAHKYYSFHGGQHGDTDSINPYDPPAASGV
jgi:putative flippase GtrA